jgi:hypothetical protein
VKSAVVAGKESEGVEALALLKTTPFFKMMLAQVEFGNISTYLTRSDWCIPSKEMYTTCLY